MVHMNSILTYWLLGNDFQRDYALLIEVAKLINMRIKVITERDIPADIPPNVEVIRGSYTNTGLSDLQLRELYQKAFVYRHTVETVFSTFGPECCIAEYGLWDTGNHHQNGGALGLPLFEGYGKYCFCSFQ